MAQDESVRSRPNGGKDSPRQWSRRAFLRGSGALAAATVAGPVLGGSAWAGPPARGRLLLARDHDAQIANVWLRRIFQRVRADGYAPPNTAPTGPANPDGYDHLTGFTPTSAARLYAYTAVAMYEAVLGGMPSYRSLAHQLDGMPPMPAADHAARYDWPTALSAAVVDTVTPLFNRERSRQELAAFHADQVQARRDAGVSATVMTASLHHGRAVAAALQPWVDADGYTRIRRKAAEEGYNPPAGPGRWEPTPPNFGPAIEPYWGEVRPFVLRGASEVRPPDPVPFSSEPGSAFYAQARHTYEVGLALTDEQRAVARFWTDNPVQSGLPSGHWMLTVGQVAVQRGLPLDRTVEALARTGVAVADAFLSCWHAKYVHNLLRPVTYVHAHIDPSWATWVNTPQFPEYTSGHSVSSLAAAVVLTDLLGSVAYTDIHDLVGGLTEAQRSRRFDSFLQAAEEAAQSRIYGGIHFPMGVDAGKDQGRLIGQLTVARLQTRR